MAKQCNELERALETIQSFGPSLRNGFISHAPMVIEAMERLGESQGIPAWVEAEIPSFVERPAPGCDIDAGSLEQSIGDPTRFADWSVFFERAIERDGWTHVLDAWAKRLAPGFTTAACHGVLRTAHAARSLSGTANATRIRELADALASWTSLYEELPVDARPGVGDRDPARALVSMTRVPAPRRPGVGPITAGYQALRFAHGFSDAVARADLSGPSLERVDQLVRLFAAEFLRSAQSPFLAVVFAHGVTGAAAVGNLHPIVGVDTASALLFRAWEAGCALVAAFGAEAPVARPRIRKTFDPGTLARRAVVHGDDHMVKLCEACLSTYARHPDPVLIEAVHLGFDLFEPKPWSQGRA